MSKARHKGMAKRAMGGGVKDKEATPANASGNPSVEKEAKAKTVAPLGGEGAKKRLDRARGGRCGGSDTSPMSASSSKNPMTSAGK